MDNLKYVSEWNKYQQPRIVCQAHREAKIARGIPLFEMAWTVAPFMGGCGECNPRTDDEDEGSSVRSAEGAMLEAYEESMGMMLD